METDMVLLTRYIAVWGWHMTAVFFLGLGLLFYTRGEIVMFMGCLIVLVICEAISYIRKRDLELEEVTEWESGDS